MHSTKNLCTKQRESNMELLRIIAMFMIVLNHFASHGFWPETDQLLISNILLDLFQIGGRLGVDLFVMISGYFLVTAGFKFKSMMRVALETILYWLFFAVLFLSIDPGLVSSVRIGIQWFPITYIGMFLFVPWLNIFISRTSRSELSRLLVVGFVVFSVIPTISINFVFSSFAWFLYLYLLAAFLRLYELPGFLKHPVRLFLICLSLIAISIIALNLLGTKLQFAANNTLFFREMNTVVTLGLALSIFLLARSFKIGSIGIINTIASTTFGIYLISDNCFLRSWVFSHFSWVYYLPPINLVLSAVGISLIYFSACGVFDYIRQKLAQKLSAPSAASALYGRFCARANGWFNQVDPHQDYPSSKDRK